MRNGESIERSHQSQTVEIFSHSAFATPHSAFASHSAFRIPHFHPIPHLLLPLAILLLIGLSVPLRAEERSKHVLLLCQGPDGHPPATHEYAVGIQLIADSLADVPGLKVTVANADGAWPEGPALIRESDGVVMFLSQGAKWIHEDPRRLEAFGQLAGRKGGFVAIHWAMGTKDARHIAGFLELFGGCHGGDDRKYKVVDTRVMRPAPDHEIVRGIGDFEIHEEFYYSLKFVDAANHVEPILQAEIEGKQETVSWAWQRSDGGRSFGFSGGHFHENWKREEYRKLFKQGVLWTLSIKIRNPKH